MIRAVVFNKSFMIYYKYEKSFSMFHFNVMVFEILPNAEEEIEKKYFQFHGQYLLGQQPTLKINIWKILKQAAAI